MQLRNDIKLFMRSLNHQLDTSGEVTSKTVNSPEIHFTGWQTYQGFTHQRMNILIRAKYINFAQQYSSYLSAHVIIIPNITQKRVTVMYTQTDFTEHLLVYWGVCLMLRPPPPPWV